MVEMPLFDLMNCFGRMFVMGETKLPFYNNLIIIDGKSLGEAGEGEG